MSCASKVASARKKAATSLRLDCCRRASNTYYLRARVLQAHLTGNQTDDGAKEQHPIAGPHAAHQGEDVELKNRLGITRCNTLESDVEIFVQTASNADKRRLLLTRFIDPNLRC